MTKINYFTLFILCFPLSMYGFTPADKLTVESRMFNYTWSSAFNPLNNEITLISMDEKTVYVLISTNGVVDQSQYSKAEEVNAHFLTTEGVIECSYAWNSNMMKIVLDKTIAKEILINTFGFAPDIIVNLF